MNGCNATAASRIGNFVLTEEHFLLQANHEDWCQVQATLQELQAEHEKQLLELEKQLNTSELERQGFSTLQHVVLTARLACDRNGAATLHAQHLQH